MQVLKPVGDSFQVTPPFRNASAQEMRKDFEKAIVLGLSHPATPVKFPQKSACGGFQCVPDSQDLTPV